MFSASSEDLQVEQPLVFCVVLCPIVAEKNAAISSSSKLLSAPVFCCCCFVFFFVRGARQSLTHDGYNGNYA